MPSVQEMMGDLQAADAAGDHQLAQHIAGLIKAQQSAPPAPAVDPGVAAFQRAGLANNQRPLAPPPPAPTQQQQVAAAAAKLPAGDQAALDARGPLVNTVDAFASSAGHNMLGIGDAAGNVGTMARQALGGKPVDYATANRMNSAERNYLSARHPVASALGGGVGAVDTAVVGGAALKAAGLVTPVTDALAATEGQVVQNLGKLAVGGATAGAVQGAAQGGGAAAAAGQNPILPAATGAAGGAVGGAVLGPVTGTAVPAVAKAVAPLAAKTAAALGRLMGEHPDDVADAWASFQQATGRTPTMAELAGLKAQADIKRAAGQNPVIGEKLIGAQDDADAARVASMQGQVAPPVVTGKQDVLNATTARGDTEYTAARAHDFTIPTEDDPTLDGVSPADHLAASVVPLAGLKTADQVRIRAGLRNGTLSGQDAQLVRSGLGSAQSRSYSPAVATAQADLDHYLGGEGNDAANEALSTATANYAKGRAAAEGTELGQQVVGAKNTPEYLGNLRGQSDAQAVATPQGVSTGLRTAAQTPASAINLAKSLATDTGLHERLTATIGRDAADALQQMGVRETAAADALSAVTPRTPAPESAGDAAAIQTAIHGLAAVASHGVWFKALHAAKVLTGTGMSDAVATKVAQYLSDPAMTSQGIALLRRAGVDNTALRNLSLNAAASAGVLSGTATADLTEQ